MGMNVVQKILEAHRVKGREIPGEEIALRIDQTLTQDATGTLVYLEFESLGIPRVRTELSVSYVDHNLLQADFRNADDHRFLQSTAARYGAWFSRPGNGISHQVHLESFGIPGKILLGSDSHTPTGGGLGMLAIGTGGLDVAMAMAGKPFYLKAPKIWGVRLTGELPPWVSAKDVILEMLRRFSVKGGVGKIIEYFGPGVAALQVPDRGTIANMGAELGATGTVFPSDENTLRFLAAEGREDQWRALTADPDAEYDEITEIDLSTLEPLIACPSSPDNVKKVSEVEGTAVHQVIIGSSVNSTYRDLMVTALVMEGRQAHPNVSFEINPGSRQVMENVAAGGGILPLIHGGARIHQSGCLGCIGMGQAPATGTVSLRTFPRNFPGRSGTEGDRVYLCSPETAVAAAVFGKITDPRKLGNYPRVDLPEQFIVNNDMILPPPEDGSQVEILRGPNIQPFPELDPLPDEIGGEVWLKVGDNITTDHIMPAGSRVLPFRSNIPAISEFVYHAVDPGFVRRARENGTGIIIGGENYGQGSSREHAALAPRYLGVRAKIVKSFARIHKANLINFGILPLEFVDPADYDRISQGDDFRIIDAKKILAGGGDEISVKIGTRRILSRAILSERERKTLIAGGLINYVRNDTIG
ncbi:MAG: aconitate hydratase [Deltaproteobacteria bacterium]|nr:aconitate hydratase [Deltaproteobacteria bacterium]